MTAAPPVQTDLFDAFARLQRDWWTVREVALALVESEQTVLALCDEGKLLWRPIGASAQELAAAQRTGKMPRAWAKLPRQERRILRSSVLEHFALTISDSPRHQVELLKRFVRELRCPVLLRQLAEELPAVAREELARRGR